MRPRIMLVVLLSTALTVGTGAAVAASHPASASSVSINFDDAPAPCNASDTSALRDQYANLGVRFRGLGPLDGGAIFDACSNFGVTGYSPPNFLGFSGAQYADGGTALGPEKITFRVAESHVEAKVAHGLGSEGAVTMTAYDGLHHVVGRASLVLTSVLAVVFVDAPGIRFVRVSSTAPAWVLDDLEAS